MSASHDRIIRRDHADLAASFLHKGIERRNRRSFLLEEDERKQQMSEDVNQESMWLTTLQAAMAKHRLISMLAR
ncbi:hypothetical protein AWB65_05961 [Caballeronia humi]|uniref:Uncharacterized protein n=1 Tax=Caballeronia humi TaxID=326474 RepID=A0A158J6E4_9BURK|nr:hypothetical protein AWB65_05961 [Caballeronia humi]